MPGRSAKRAAQRAQIAEGMAAARRWRLARQTYDGMGVFCLRCEGSGAAWWLGKPGEGGAKGPCPRCQVERARQFVANHGRLLFQC